MPKENWFIKNIFSIIALVVTWSGFVAGYARLQTTVQEMRMHWIDKEVVRAVVIDVFSDKLALINKDLTYTNEKLTKAEENIRNLYKLIGESRSIPLIRSVPIPKISSLKD